LSFSLYKLAFIGLSTEIGFSLSGEAMKGEIEKFHACGQSIWVKGWRDGKTIFCIGPPGQRIWVEHCPKCGEKLSLEDLAYGDKLKWE
jgi:hypothetical protein